MHDTKHLIVIESMFFSTGFKICKLAQDMGFKVTLICRDIKMYLDRDGMENDLLKADYIIERETNSSKELIEFLKNYSLEKPFDGIITLSDYYIEIVSEVADYFNLPSEKAEVIKAAKNKNITRSILSEKQVPSPKFLVSEERAEVLEGAKQIGFPCIIKPVRDTGSNNVLCVANEKELIKGIADIQNIHFNERGQEYSKLILLEEFLLGEELSVETFTQNGHINLIGFTSKRLTGNPYFVEDGFSFPYELSNDLRNKVFEITASALKAIGHSFGPCHTEVKLTEEGPKIIEINPRLGGRFLVDLIKDSIGIDLIKEWIKVSVGLDGDFQPNYIKKGAAYSVITSKNEGYFMGIKGIEEALKVKYIKKITLDVKKGDFISRPQKNADSLGFIYAIADNTQTALSSIERAEKYLKIKVKD